MSAMDSAMNFAGTILELVAVVMGGLATPVAGPVRQWIQQRIATIVWLSFPLVSAVLLALGIFLPENSSARLPLLIAGGFPLVTGSGVGLGKWIARMSDDSLVRVLQLMAVLFGIGVLLQAIAAGMAIA